MTDFVVFIRLDALSKGFVDSTDTCIFEVAVNKTHEDFSYNNSDDDVAVDSSNNQQSCKRLKFRYCLFHKFINH